MSAKKERYVSEWKPFRELRKIQDDITELGYKREYVDEHGLEETMHLHWGTYDGKGAVCFFEPIEVKKDEDEVLWRLNENHVHREIPETFNTQFGVFNNHNRGEFASWLGKDEYLGLPEDEREIKKAFGMVDFLVDGNYCDMFDSGEYCYAISNLMHLGLGEFKIIRIDKDLEVDTMYDNHDHWFERLEYLGRFPRDKSQMIIASGSRELDKGKDEKSKYQELTLLFCIDENGNCGIQKEWDFTISHSNSLVIVENCAYFGQNKMITRLDLTSGKVEYFTDKRDEELAVLVKGW